MNESDREKRLNWKTSSVIGWTQSRDRSNGVTFMLIPIEQEANNGECKREKCKDYDRNLHSKLDYYVWIL